MAFAISHKHSHAGLDEAMQARLPSGARRVIGLIGLGWARVHS